MDVNITGVFYINNHKEKHLLWKSQNSILRGSMLWLYENRDVFT